MNFALVDANFLIALYNSSDSEHERCVEVLNGLSRRLATCDAVIAESLHMLRFTHGASEAILSSIESGALEIHFNLSESAAAIRANMGKYRATPCDFADACLIHMADKLGTGDILTLDSDFKHYRWRRTRHFRMLVPSV